MTIAGTAFARAGTAVERQAFAATGGAAVTRGIAAVEIAPAAPEPSAMAWGPPASVAGPSTGPGSAAAAIPVPQARAAAGRHGKLGAEYHPPAADGLVMLVLLFPGHGLGGDVCCFSEQPACFSAVQIRLDLAAVACWVPDGQHHGRGGCSEEPQQGNRPGQLVRGQVGQAPQGQDFGGQGLDAGVYVD